jgi:nucleoid-associated protein YgaU
MDIYLVDDTAGVTFQLPVNPDKIVIKREKLLDTVTILNMGEADFTIGTKVTEISLSSFLPIAYDSEYCQYASIPDPQQAMQQLTTWTVSKKPVRLIITTTVVNTLVLVDAHTSTFQGGEPGDVYYDLTLRTWNPITVRTQAQVQAAAAVNVSALQTRPDTKPVPKTYTVKSGDSLFIIAKMCLGDGSKWQAIYTANQSTIGPNPNLIKPGMALVMP